MSSALGIRALQISLAGLLATAAFQGVIAIAGGSAGLLADTIHNLADAFTTIPLWIAFALARRAATRRFTYGYGRAEDLAGVVVLLFVLLSAASAAYESYDKLLNPAQPKFIEWSLLAAVVGMIGNEAVARYKISVGKKIGSAALVAEGQHARVDSLTSLAAGVGLLGVKAGYPLADPIAGFVITLAILGIVLEVGRGVMSRLMDAVDPSVIDEIEKHARAVEAVRGVHDVKARWVGHSLVATLHIEMDGGLSLEQAHVVCDNVRRELLAHVSRLADVIIHPDPAQ